MWSVSIDQDKFGKMAPSCKTSHSQEPLDFPSHFLSGHWELSLLSEAEPAWQKNLSTVPKYSYCEETLGRLLSSRGERRCWPSRPEIVTMATPGSVDCSVWRLRFTNHGWQRMMGMTGKSLKYNWRSNARQFHNVQIHMHPWSKALSSIGVPRWRVNMCDGPRHG